MVNVINHANWLRRPKECLKWLGEWLPEPGVQLYERQ